MDKNSINKIAEYLTGQPVEKAWLFGSYARNEETNDSDIDLLVSFLPGTKITLFQYAHLVNELEKLTGKNIDLVEEGQLKDFAEESAAHDKLLIYERKAKG
jgi:predicted nucleotidyltransferase